jgi:hypothetical protein
MHAKHNVSLLGIQVVTADLGKNIDTASGVLEATGTYPFNDQIAEDDSCCNSSEIEEAN